MIRVSTDTLALIEVYRGILIYGNSGSPIHLFYEARSAELDINEVTHFIFDSLGECKNFIDKNLN